jgi:hypothetical protein
MSRKAARARPGHAEEALEAYSACIGRESDRDTYYVIVIAELISDLLHLGQSLNKVEQRRIEVPAGTPRSLNAACSVGMVVAQANQADLDGTVEKFVQVSPVRFAHRLLHRQKGQELRGSRPFFV